MSLSKLNQSYQVREISDLIIDLTTTKSVKPIITSYYFIFYDQILVGLIKVFLIDWETITKPQRSSLDKNPDSAIAYIRMVAQIQRWR